MRGDAPNPTEASTDFAAVFEWQPTAYLLMSPDLVIVDANRAYQQLLGRNRAELVGRPVFEAFPPAPESLDANGDNPLQLSFERARDLQRPDQMPLFDYDVLDQATGQMVHRVWSLISAPVFDAEGRTRLVLQRVEDVSDYMAARQQPAGPAAGADAVRLQLLEADLFARAQELRAALDARETATTRLAGMAQVALRLAAATSIAEVTETVASAGLTAVGADGGAICVVDEERDVVRITVSDALGDDVRQRYGELPRDSPLPAPWVARTGRRVLLADRAAGLAWSPAMAQVHEDTGRLSWVFLPLWARGRLLGSLAAAWEAERAVPQDELDLLEAFAAQCAQALDRMQVQKAERRVAEANRQLSETWQRSLLTEPPPLEHLDIAVRYRPASADAQVGGDWYDAFLIEDGSLTLVVGDVTGHDRTAAAAMAQIRNVLRGVAQSVQRPPADVLTALDTTLRNLRVNALATAVLAQVREDAERSGDRAVWWSNAGHPPPLLLEADGNATLLEHPADLLLGVDPAAARHDHRVPLPAGATLLLYTDGLVERPGQDLDEGTELLRTTAAELAGLPVDDLCDQLLDRLVPTPTDDVALLVIRPSVTTGGASSPLWLERPLPDVAGQVWAWEIAAPPWLARVRADIRRRIDATPGVPGSDSEGAERLLLAFEELTSNGLRHGLPPVTASITVGDTGWLLDVADGAVGQAPAEAVDRDPALGGLGLYLTAALGTAHGWCVTGDRKHVWALLPFDGPLAG